MRRSRRVLLTCVVLVGLGFFFLAPVFYWLTTFDHPPFFYSATIYRSAGCVILGYGVLYLPNGTGGYGNERGLWLGCKLPAPPGGGIP